MASFAERDRRYLWTDAFAVCNFLGLGQTEQALTLIDRVHHMLGRHRSDDTRRGWISGLPDAEGEAHPTIGGLRIGKPLPEDADDEWERDGQYFHYLTKWMHALDQAARATGNTQLRTWARELGLAIGLAAVERMKVADFARFMPLRDAIVELWPAHRNDPTYLEHQDINDVMLATSLLPNGFIDLLPCRPS